MEQQTGSQKENEYIKVVHCHPAYLTYMQSTSYMHHFSNAVPNEAQAGISIARRNINNLRYTVDTTLMEESEEDWKLNDANEPEVWKSWVKTQHSEN